MPVEVKVSGLPDLRAALKGIPEKLRKRVLRNALAAGARLVRDEARRRAPVLRTTTRSGASAIRRGIRKPGTMRDAISVRTSKQARRAGNVGVFVNVKPAKAAQRGAKSPNDPFYWRWQNFGWAGKAGAHFLEEGGKKLQQALQIFIAKIGPAIEKLNGGKDVQL